MHNCYTFYDIELQIGMRDADKAKQFEKWLIDKFAREGDVMLQGLDCSHAVNHIDFRGKPHLSYEFVGPDGFKNYLVMCAENVSDMCACMKEFIKLVDGPSIDLDDQQTDPNVIKW